MFYVKMTTSDGGGVCIPLVVKQPRNRPVTISINKNNIPNSRNNNFSGLEFNARDYGYQANKSKIVAEQQLSKLKKLPGLSQHNKLKLNKAIILQALIYITVPLNSVTLPTKYKLQIAQNKALCFITNAERLTNNHTLHTIYNIDPINITYPSQAS